MLEFLTGEVRTGKNKIYYVFALGFISGLFVSVQFRETIDFVLTLISLYLFSVFSFRCLVCWLTISEVDFFLKKSKLSLENFSIEYNLWYNSIVIRRDIVGKIVTDKTVIIAVCRRRLNTLLFWDIFYHIHPIKITFE